MGRLDDLRKLASAATDPGTRDALAKAAGNAVVGAAGAVDAVGSIAERSGLTGKDGELSTFKVARAALRPSKTARTVLAATADEIQAYREQDRALGPPGTAPGAAARAEAWVCSREAQARQVARRTTKRCPQREPEGPGTV